MLASLLLVLATSAATAEPDVALDIRPCEYPLWVTIIDQRTPLPVERDFAGCGDGPLMLELPEGTEIGSDDVAAEEARLGKLSARVDGETLRIGFQPGDQDDAFEIATGFDTAAVVGDGRYTLLARRATGGPYVRARIRNQPVADVARTLARATGARVVGALPFDDERITIDFDRVPVAILWELVGDAGASWVAYWPQQRVVRFWRGAVPSTTANASERDPSTTDAIALALPDLASVNATAEAAERACSSNGRLRRCIALQEKVLAQLPADGPVGQYQRVSATTALLDAYRAAGRSDDTQRMDARLAAAVRAGEVDRVDWSLELLRKLLDLGAAPASVAALLATASAQLANEPPQQVRLSLLALDAMWLEPLSGHPDAVRRLRQLANRYFEIEVGPKRGDLAPVGASDSTMDMVRRSLARSAETIADTSIARQAANDAAFALFIMEVGAADDADAQSRIEGLRARLDALQPDATDSPREP